mmetsp:Transcript_6761/g.25428  ORF Transcript_6761/g.25428 Transcript_6761/m.25428 type:complete len:203 (-) Transcript_6761:529-1137(-)
MRARCRRGGRPSRGSRPRQGPETEALAIPTLSNGPAGARATCPGGACRGAPAASCGASGRTRRCRSWSKCPARRISKACCTARDVPGCQGCGRSPHRPSSAQEGHHRPRQGLHRRRLSLEGRDDDPPLLAGTCSRASHEIPRHWGGTPRRRGAGMERCCRMNETGAWSDRLAEESAAAALRQDFGPRLCCGPQVRPSQRSTG